MEAKVMQYMRPNGRQVLQTVNISDDCSGKYSEMTDCGFRLAAEQLMTGVVSSTIEGFGFDYDMELTSGGDLKKNIEALEKMILRFNSARAMAQIMEME
jgi:hypothetical protein